MDFDIFCIFHQNLREIFEQKSINLDTMITNFCTSSLDVDRKDSLNSQHYKLAYGTIDYHRITNKKLGQ